MINREKLIRLTLVLVSVFFCLVVIELGLRVVYPQINEHDKMFQFDPELGWSFIPEKRGAIVYPGEANHFITINKSGFRDGPFEEGAQQRRILVIGDSFVSNVSVAAEDVFTEVLERQLYKTSVMNLGVNGYGQVQELILMHQWLEKVNPDLVVLTVYVRNDFADNMGKGQWNYDKPIAVWNDSLRLVKMNERVSEMGKIGSKPSARRHSYRKLHLYHLIARSLFNMRAKYLSKGEEEALSYVPPELYLCQTSPSVEMLTMRQVMEQLLLQISEELKARNIPLVLVLAPSIVQVEDDLWQRLMTQYGESESTYDRALPNKQLKAFGDAQGILTLDLLPELYRLSQEKPGLYNPQEQHWTRAGNQVVANALRAFIEAHFAEIFKPALPVTD